jgi:general secretion pathway protein G
MTRSPSISSQIRHPRAPRRRRSHGFTLLELAIALGIAAVLAALGGVSYSAYLERTRMRQAILQVRTIEDLIMAFEIEYETLPADLADVGADGMLDPWGNPYEYLRIVGAPPSVMANVRKDKFLVPLNSDFDLYSKGPDADSKPPLTAPQSHDDIIRANNGGFVGLGEQY